MCFSSAVIVAGGSGKRMGAKIPKQFLLLNEKPILFHTVSLFNKCPQINEMVVVLPENDITWFKESIEKNLSFKKPFKVVKGGKERQDSVKNGISSVSEQSDIVLIHDGVRPFVTENHIKELINECLKYDCVIPGLSVSETVKRSDSKNYIVETISRDNLFLAQTPQVFKTSVLKKAHDYAEKNNIAATDDALLLEETGHKVKIYNGLRANIKITTPEDLEFANLIINNFTI